jgi:hypothetical protein
MKIIDIELTTEEVLSCLPIGITIQVESNFLKCYLSRRDLNLNKPLLIQPSLDINKFVGACLQKITEIESVRSAPFAGYSTKKIFELHSRQLLFKEKPKPMTLEERIKSGDILVPQYEKDLMDPNKIPITRGCSNPQCFCDGKCKKIIGFRDRLFNENPRKV